MNSRKYIYTFEEGNGKDKILLEQEGKMIELPNDAVIVCAGGILPTPFLKQIGVIVESKFGTE